MENHFSGFLNARSLRRDHARESRRQLRPQRDFALAFVGKIKKLRHDLRAAFFCEKLRRLEHRAVPFDEAVAPRDFAPLREDIISHGAIARQKITKTGERLHQRKRETTAENIRLTKAKDKQERRTASLRSRAGISGAISTRSRRWRPAVETPASSRVPALILSEAAINRGGSPGRRGFSTTGIGWPVISRQVSITSRTLEPPPVPRL